MIYKILRISDIAGIRCGKMSPVVSDTEVEGPDTKESMPKPAALITEDGETEAWGHGGMMHGGTVSAY